MTAANWYDILDVDPTASADEIRATWRSAVADLDPTDRRFRVYSQAAEVLLDPAARTSYDAGLERERGRSDAAKPRRNDRSETEASLLARPLPRRNDRSETEASLLARPHSRRSRLVPGWVLVVMAAFLAGSLVVAGVLLAEPSDSAVEGDTQAAQAAAERAIVPLLSYDARHLDQSAAAAQPLMTSSEQTEYDKLFAVIRQNAPRTGTVVNARYLASGVVRSGTDRVDVLVLVDQVTRNKAHPKAPVVYKNQVTVSMAKVGDRWLVDGLTTNSS